MKPTTLAASFLGMSLLWAGCACAQGLTGQYLATGNFDAYGSIKPSMNNRLTASYAPAWKFGNFDLRLEQYVENSYHGANGSLVRERKFEAQVNFNYPLTKELFAKVGILRHENSTFRDNYNWIVAGIVWNGDIATYTNLTTGILVEKRTLGGRPFFDTSATLEHRFLKKLGVFSAIHLYENFGEFDISPTRKKEYEVGINHYLDKRYAIGLSYFNHRQFGDPTDRFSFVKLKVAINF